VLVKLAELSAWQPRRERPVLAMKLPRLMISSKPQREGLGPRSFRLAEKLGPGSSRPLNLRWHEAKV
jgi:hypothetical protein